MRVFRDNIFPAGQRYPGNHEVLDIDCFASETVLEFCGAFRGHSVEVNHCHG